MHRSIALEVDKNPKLLDTGYTISILESLVVSLLAQNANLLNHKIELICQRLKHAVTPTEVVEWLLNFAEADQPHVLDLLLLHEYITSNDIFGSYHDSFKRICDQLHKGSTVIVHPIGEFGKSGTAMAYYAKKAIKPFQDDYTFHFYDNHKKFKTKRQENNNIANLSIVFIDDIYGSGESALNYIRTFVAPQLNGHPSLRLYFVSIAALSEAKDHIEQSFPGSKVICSVLRDKLFSTSNRMLFGSVEKLKQTRQICYDYGQKQFPGDTDADDRPLGYANSQALISFCFGTPNNTLPIIWGSLNGWRPLFPRFIDGKISNAKAYRKEVAFWLSIAKAYGMMDFVSYNEIDEIVTIGKDNFQLFAVMKLLIEKADKPIICHMLGLFEEDYHKIIEDGRQKGYINTNGGLTRTGYEIYEKIDLLMQKIYKSQKLSASESNPPAYVPLSFRGIINANG